MYKKTANKKMSEEKELFLDSNHMKHIQAKEEVLVNVLGSAPGGLFSKKKKNNFENFETSNLNSNFLTGEKNQTSNSNVEMNKNNEKATENKANNENLNDLKKIEIFENSNTTSNSSNADSEFAITGNEKEGWLFKQKSSTNVWRKYFF